MKPSGVTFMCGDRVDEIPLEQERAMAEVKPLTTEDMMDAANTPKPPAAPKPPANPTPPTPPSPPPSSGTSGS